jgi:hypothetical protein
MAKNFRKEAANRQIQAIAKALDFGTSKIVTDDITKGDFVDVEFEGGQTTYYASVKGRRAHAIPVSISLSGMCELHWYIDGRRLTVTTNDSTRTGTVTFLVF